MNWWETSLVAIGLAIVTAFLTTLASEPLKRWIYRGQYADERRLDAQIAALPPYIKALGEASSACANVNFGWVAKNEPRMMTVSRAAERLGSAVNAGLDIKFLFPHDVRDKIDRLNSEMRQAFSSYMIFANATQPTPTEPDDALRKVFERQVTVVDAMRNDMMLVLRKLLGYNEP